MVIEVDVIKEKYKTYFWAIYSFADVPLGIGKIISEDSDVGIISYGEETSSELFSKDNYKSFQFLPDAVEVFCEIQNHTSLERCVEDLSENFPAEKENLENIFN